jgi:hypothetical protein
MKTTRKRVKLLLYLICDAHLEIEDGTNLEDKNVISPQDATALLTHLGRLPFEAFAYMLCRSSLLSQPPMHTQSP